MWQKFPYCTFKQIEEESLSVCDLYDPNLIWIHFFMYLLLVVFIQETEGVAHADDVAEVQGLAVLSQVFCTNPYIVIFLCCS